MPKEVPKVAELLSLDYYYGDESAQFSFYRIPRLLVTGDEFKRLSTDAKLLYGLLLDRMGLSAKNGWFEGQGRVIIYYTLDEIQTDLGCGHEKAVKLLAELDSSGRGIGLIERVKRGQGKPSRIYVKRFTTREIPPQSSEPQRIPRLPIFGSQDFGKSEVKSSEKQKCRLRNIGSADFRKSDASYIESSQTDFSQLDPSIYPSGFTPPGLMDGCDCRGEIRERIGYEVLCDRYSREDVDEVVELLADTLNTTRPTVRVGGGDIPTGQVCDRLQRLEFIHIEYVFDCLYRNSTQVRNIRAYLLTALYNAPTTINHYYQAAVQHDWPTQ